MEDSKTTTCPNCGARNSPNVRNCEYCGSQIDRTGTVCANCGHKNPPGVRYYCNSCEQPLVAAKSEPAPDLVATEDTLSGSASATETQPEQATSNESSPESASVSDTRPGSSLNPPKPGVQICPRCQHSNEPGFSYCFNCGLPLDHVGAAGTSSTIGAFKHGTPAGFWIRVVAAILDYLVVSTVNLTVSLLYGVSILEYIGVGINVNPETPFEPLERFTGIDWIIYLANMIFSIVYAPILISLWGTTVGKRPFDLYVVKADGGRCRFWRALGRESAKYISAVVLFVGYLMVAFRKDKRGLHDLIAGTAVIKR